VQGCGRRRPVQVRWRVPVSGDDQHAVAGDRPLQVWSRLPGREETSRLEYLSPMDTKAGSARAARPRPPYSDDHRPGGTANRRFSEANGRSTKRKSPSGSPRAGTRPPNIGRPRRRPRRLVSAVNERGHVDRDVECLATRLPDRPGWKNRRNRRAWVRRARGGLVRTLTGGRPFLHEACEWIADRLETGRNQDLQHHGHDGHQCWAARSAGRGGHRGALAATRHRGSSSPARSGRIGDVRKLARDMVLRASTEQEIPWNETTERAEGSRRRQR
jgi:hypothetical protein